MQQRGPADVHVPSQSSPAGLEETDMKFKTLAAGTIGPLIALGLLLVRRLRRKHLVAGEVSALRGIGAGRERG